MYLKIKSTYKHLPLATLLLTLSASPSWAQATPPSSARQLPASAAQQPSTAMQQSATPSPAPSVNTLNTQVHVQGAYAGSTLDPNAPTDAITLTLADAVRRGLQFNLGKIGADTASRQAEAQRLAARSAFLPNVSAGLSENAAKISLEAEGLSANTFGAAAGEFPTTAGPFHYYDVRGSLQQNVMDFTALHNYHSAKDSANAASLNAIQSREEVVLAVAGTYLQIMATAALIDAQRTEVEYAEASYKQAKAQAEAGNKAPIDANRSLVELQTEQQRLRSQLGDLQKQKNSLARLIGLPLGIEIVILEKLENVASDNAPAEEYVKRAWAHRQDLRAAEMQLHAAEESRKAAGAEHLPSASINGFYGMQGINPNQGNGVFQATASLNIPIFNSGRTHADTAEADAVLAERRAELSNERGAVELEVRNALIDLTIANEQVSTAESNHKLAVAILQQSQDRFAVGVVDSVEVVNSQQTLASADHDLVSSLFAQNLAKVALAHAMGEAETDLPDLFKGNK